MQFQLSPGVVLDAAVAVPIIIVIVTLAFSLPPSRAFRSRRDKLVAAWYLFNGVIIHIFLDGLVGFAGFVPYLREKYWALDQRYQHKESSVMMISLVELFIMGPLCVLLFHAYTRNKPWKDPLELIVCSIQIMGTIVFTGAEMWEGFPHIPTDFEFSFTAEKVVYFWIFFVMANILWIVLPLNLLWTAFFNITWKFAAPPFPSNVKSTKGAQMKKKSK
jgi:cholestenol delta-isomerase